MSKFSYKICGIGDRDAYKDLESYLVNSVVESKTKMETGKMTQGYVNVVSSEKDFISGQICFVEVKLESV